MDLSLAAEHRLGIRLSQRWWEQPAQDILGIRAVHMAAEMGLENCALLLVTANPLTKDFASD